MIQAVALLANQPIENPSPGKQPGITGLETIKSPRVESFLVSPVRAIERLKAHQPS